MPNQPQGGELVKSRQFQIISPNAA